MATRMLRTAPLLLAIALLAGCATAPATDATNTSAPVETTAAPTATPSETQPVVEEEPAQAVVAFDGDCNALLDAQTLASLPSPDMALDSTPSDSLESVLTDAALRESGMLVCVWRSPSVSDWLSVVVAPLESVPSAIVEATQVTNCAPVLGATVCRAGVAVGNAWVAVSAYTEETLQKVLAAAGATLIGEEPQAAAFPAGSWQTPDCVALVPVVASGTNTPGLMTGYPSDNNPQGFYLDVLTAHGSFAYCGFQGDSTAANPTPVRAFFAAGVGVADIEALGLPEITVSGADRAWQEAETGEIVAAVGPNVLLLGPNRFADDAAQQWAAVLTGAMTVRAES